MLNTLPGLSEDQGRA